MTMHDDPDLRRLERDLSILAAPRERDEELRLALRAQLLAPPQRRAVRRRTPTRLALGSAAVAAAAALALLLVVGTAGSGGPAAADAAIIHHAVQAVTPPPDHILHTEVVGVQSGVPVMAESWQETSAPFASRGMKGEPGHQGEFGDDGRTSFEYDPSTNTIHEQPDSSAPTFADPLSQVRSELAGGQAQVAGTAVIDGVALYKVDLPHGLVGYFDQTDYHPRYLDDPQRDGSVIRLRIVAYEYLPMTAANRALLSVTAQHPSARIVAASNGGAGG
jgi:hypothetical protein